MVYNRIKHVSPHFRFQGRFAQAQEVHSGNVNNTFILIYHQGSETNSYTLQRINTYVFKNPRSVMTNIAAVTDHLRKNIGASRADVSRMALEVIRTDDGDVMYLDGEGGTWRAYSYIPDALALDMVENLEQMAEVGHAFGRFQRHLADFPADKLFVTIPDFHHSTKRFYTFVRSVEEDRAGRVPALEDEIEFFFERRRMLGEIVRLLDRGELPLRVTHNDTKSNNVLLDKKTGKALCVIDLDTVMPGSALYDYGDAVRFGASNAPEDEPDVARVSLNMDKARAFTQGFVEETAGFLTQAELSRLPLGIKVITAELAMRFLTDYLDGDRYFKVDYPEHNLVRARAQMALLEDVERKEEALYRMVTEDVRRFGGA
ncbi:MAG: aminoglycoside phosphotransferase family protein [Eubacteriales bacterium]|nr:aminoglycoside phosphotransferase family protein [Eubacteriales bacterium]